ncbi:MAG: InlB B-repeat-containing protein, partial [Clostridia bacterium]|nr:InlB B-repeat-containing protein [Clostridia bacterium]
IRKNPVSSKGNIILDAGEGYFDTTENEITVQAEIGTDFVPYDNPMPRLDGYVFAGWAFENGEFVTLENPVKVGYEDIALYAVWEIETKRYNLELNANGGLFDDGSESITCDFEPGEVVALPDNVKKEGCNFVGWVNENDEIVNRFVMPAKDVTLTAVWEAEEYTVTFNTDGGNEIEALTLTFGEEFTLPSAKKIGHSFAFWRDESGNMYVAGQKVAMPAKDKTFKAVWFVQSKSVTYTIGNDTVKFDVVPGNEIPLPDMSVYENAELLYWLDANGKRVTEFPAAMPESNLTFTAVLRYTFVDGKYGITASFESGCFDYEGDELDFVVEKFNGVKESGGVYYKDDNYKQIEFYNIKFCHGATTVQPQKGGVVHIGIPVPAAYKDGTEFLVIHRYGGDGYEQITQTKNGDKLEFDVNQFGDFEVCVESGTTVKTSPSKTSYAYKESLDLSGLTLEVLDANGNKAIISDTSKMNVKGYDSKKIGKQTVTVEYDGTTTHFDVSVAYTWWQTLIRILLLGFLWY